MSTASALPAVGVDSDGGPSRKPTHSLSALGRSTSSALGRGVRVTLQDFSFSVKDRRPGRKGQTLYLLKYVNGYFNPGQMSALLGPSGSGKTTLLDLLAGRKTSGSSQGVLRFGGVEPTQAYLRRHTGYVEQFDTLLPILTVYEMLMYTAELKRPLAESLSAKQEVVEEVLATLALDTCRNVKIGSRMSTGISGGQAKRTNIGIALVTSPRVLFLDEPTTGLDSFTANEVMSVVQSLAHNGGVTVLATIHSPSAYTFSLFDDMMLLLGGRVVYFGPQGHAAVTFFQESCPHVKEYEPGYNDAEWIVDLVTEADRFGKGGEFADAYASSALAAQARAALEESSGERHDLPDEVVKELKVSKATTTPMWWGLRTFVKYRTRKNYTDPAFLAPRIFDKLIIALLVMTLYLGIGDQIQPDNIINIAAVLFMWSATTGFSAASYVPALVLERPLFVRERADGLYLPVTYLMAKMMDELMVNAVASLGIAAFTFYGIQLQGSFGLFYISYFAGVAVGISLAYFVASFAPSMDVANALVPVYSVTLLFFAGFLIRIDNLPPWWKWYSYINFARWAWGANMINQFENNDIEYMGGLSVLQYFGMDGCDKWAYVGYIALFYAFFFCSTWAVLHFKKYTSR